MIKKGKLLLLVFGCIFFNIKALAFREYQSGDKVIFNDEDYYVISDSDGSKKYITLVKAKALTVDEIARYGKDNNGNLFVNSHYINLDDPEQVIYDFGDDVGGISFYSAEDCSMTYHWNGSSYSYDENNVSGCKYHYDDSDVKKVVDNWSSSFSDKLVKVDGYESRLLYLSELVNDFDYRISSGENYIKGVNTPTFLSEVHYPQWIIYSRERDNDRISIFNGESINVRSYQYVNVSNNAIRPVINLNKCALGDNDNYCQDYSKDSNENIIEKHGKSFKSGEMIFYNDDLYYVIEESDESQDYVTLLKKDALTVEELYEYGKDQNGDLFINSHTIDLDDINRKVYDVNTGVNVGEISYYSSNNCSAEYHGNNGAGNYFLQNAILTECKNSYDISDVKKVVDNWANIFSDDLVEVNGYKARLINIDDLYIYLSDQNINSEYASSFKNKMLDKSYWFLYAGYDALYWTMGGLEDSNIENLLISANGSVLSKQVVSLGAVRPVINLKKCALYNECNIPNDEVEDVPEPDIPTPEIKEEPQQVNVDNTSKNMSGIFLISILVLISGIVIIAYIYNKSIKEKK